MKNLKLLIVTHWTLFVTAILCLGIGFLAEKGLKEYRTQRILTDDEAAMEVLNRIIVLPNEVPSIATVTDTEKLGDQPFLAAAENGDKVVIYKENRRAYLFRPREEKIIDMTVVNIESPLPESIPVFQTDGE